MKLEKALFTFLFFNLNFLLYSQNKRNNDSITAVQIKITNSNYIDFTVSDKYLFALNSDDILAVIDLETNTLSKTYTKIFAISKNQRNEIVICTKNAIKNLDNKNSKKIK